MAIQLKNWREVTMARRITAQQRRHTANKALRQARQAEDALKDDVARELEHRFLDKFTICEVAYKSILSDWLDNQGKSVKDDDLHIESRQISSVLKFAGVELDSDTQKLIFGARRNIGNRGGRRLRNDIVHNPNKRSIEEIHLRFQELDTAMDKFLAALDEAAKRSDHQ